MPGSPSTPAHSVPVRAAYALISLLLGLTGGLGNALVSANLPAIQGHLGLTPIEGGWLPAAYLMFNVSANLLLFKCRQQFGLQRFAEIGLSIYALTTVLYLFADNFEMALLARAANGFAAAFMSTLCVMYMLQAFPKAGFGQAIVLGLGINQLATPVAWLLSPSLLDLGEWRTLYVFELGLALCGLAAVVTLKLPPGIRVKVIERADFLTFALLAPALALLIAVLIQGRAQWWTEQPWMAGALIAAIALLTAGVLFEHHRRNPLLQTRWMGTASTVRFVIGAFGIRFLLSEQTYGATSFLRTLGMGPDQLQPLYAVILAGLVLGVVSSALTFNQKAMLPQILISVVLIAVGSFLDWNATSLTRPHDMFVSQFLVSMATGLFMGPVLLTGIMSALKQGSDHLVSFIVIFTISQSFGGSAGSAILGTVQQFREHEYSALITAGVDPTQGVVSQRVKSQGQIYGAVITDPVLRQAQGMAQLSQTATREANVRAYNDIFLLNGLLALALLAWSLVHTVRLGLQAKKDETAAGAMPADGAGA